MVIALAAILATSAAFADHPGGFGVGIVGQYGWGYGGGNGNGGLSLKIPSIPVFWAINFGGGPNHFAIGLTGDYYIIDQALPVPTLNWFLGIGGFLNFHSYNYNNGRDKSSYTSFNFGPRVPIGLSWQPVKLLELWIDVAPSLGLYITGANKDYGGSVGLYWFMPFELGLRLWF